MDESLSPRVARRQSGRGSCCSRYLNSVSTVERSVSSPDGVASRTAKIPTPKIAATSRKSRLNTRITAANAKARLIRYMATLRPVSPARLAACSRESVPPEFFSEPAPGALDNAAPAGAVIEARPKMDRPIAASDRQLRVRARARIPPSPTQPPVPDSGVMRLQHPITCRHGPVSSGRGCRLRVRDRQRSGSSELALGLLAP